MPEEESTVKGLTSLWEVRTKVSCDTLTPMVGAFKPMLEDNFNTLAVVLIANDEE